MVRRQLEEVGLHTEWAGFRFNDDLYSVLALHFGLGTLGSLLARRAPWAGALLHLTAGGSYWADSTHRHSLLRRLRPQRWSQNLLATIPARGELRLRIVLPAHIDAALTGLLFEPRFTGLLKGDAPPWAAGLLERPLAAVTHSQLALAGLAALRGLRGRPLPAEGVLRLLLSAPALATFALTADVVRRDQVVPGANDDLTGVAGSIALARRLVGRLPPGVEVVLAITGAEEAGLGGARALAASGRWAPERTVVLGLDGLSGGALRYFEEGEIERVAVPSWLEQLLGELASSEARFAGVSRFTIPVGATDVYAFRRRGFDGVCLGCVDSELGSPRHYHLPTDTPDRLDMDEFADAVDFAEALIWRIIERRTGGEPSPSE